MTVLEAGLSRDRLNVVMDNLPPHLRSLLVAVRDHRVAFMFIPQNFDTFRIPARADRPSIVLIGDDMEAAHGPDGFHMPSLRRIIRGCSAFAVISSAPPADLYAAMASTTAMRRASTLLIETRLEQEIAWVGLIQKLAPGRPVVLATVTGGNA